MEKVLLIITIAVFNTELYCQKILYENPYYLPSEIQISEIQYADVQLGNTVKIWEEELNLDRSLSYLIDYSSGISLSMDFYRPVGNRIRPAVILLHGGAFLPNMGSKEDLSIQEIAMQLTSRGYIVFAVQYRLMNLFTPSFIKAGYVAAQDTRAAIKYIANHSKELNVDTEKLFIAGISAGGVTALSAAFLDDNDDIEGRSGKLNKMYGCIDCVGEQLNKNYKIKGVINIAGGIFDDNLFEHNREIPILSIHGVDDNIVPINCDLPFRKYSEEYNDFINYLIGVTSAYPKIQRELREATIQEICGSRIIDSVYREKRWSSELHELQDSDHYLMMSLNGTITTRGLQTITEMSEFLLKHSSVN